MGNEYSNSPPEPTPLSDSSEQMPDFNNLFQEGVSKMMRVTDDLHRMVDYMFIRDLTIIGLLIFFILKYRNGKQKQKRRRRSNRGKYRFNGIRSEHSTIGNRYMNENSDAFMSKVHLFDDILICGECRFRTNNINKFADHKSREREMLCNENSPILCDSTDAHEMSKDCCIGEIVDEKKQPYTYDKKPIAPTTKTSTTNGGFNAFNKNIAKIQHSGTTKIKNVQNAWNQNQSNKNK